MRKLKEIKLKNLMMIMLSVFIVFLAIHYWPSISAVLGVLVSASVPLIVGCLIAYIVNIPMSYYERVLFFAAKSSFSKKIKRPVCIILAVLSIIAIVAAVLTLIIPEFINAVDLIIQQIRAFIKNLENIPRIYNLIPKEVIQRLSSMDWESTIKQAWGFLVNGIGGTVNVVFSTIRSIFSSAFDVFIAIAFSLYILAFKEKISRQIKVLLSTYVKKDKLNVVYRIKDTVNVTFHSFIVGQCFEAVVLGTLCTLGMVVFRFPNAMSIGALVGLTALIPIAGAWIGAGIGAFLIFTVSPIKALLFIVYIVVLQQLENNLIYPKVVGTSIGLPGFMVLAAITIGGGTLGIGGMLLSVPLVASIYKLVKNDVEKKQLALADTKKAEKVEPPAQNS